MSKLSDSPSEAVTVEQTSKTLKLQKALSTVLLIVCAVFYSVLFLTISKSVTWLAWGAGIGLAWNAVTRARIWWYHH